MIIQIDQAIVYDSVFIIAPPKLNSLLSLEMVKTFKSLFFWPASCIKVIFKVKLLGY